MEYRYIYFDMYQGDLYMLVPVVQNRFSCTKHVECEVVMLLFIVCNCVLILYFCWKVLLALPNAQHFLFFAIVVHSEKNVLVCNSFWIFPHINWRLESKSLMKSISSRDLPPLRMQPTGVSYIYTYILQY